MIVKMLVAIAFAVAAVTHPATDFVRPTNTALQDSLNELTGCRLPDLLECVSVCQSPDLLECVSPKRAYKVHDASCISIAPENDRVTIACRIDSTITYEDSKQRYWRYRDWCARFSKRGKQDGGTEWEFIQIRDRPCEIPNMLTSDPNLTPGQVDIEHALVRLLTCYDFDGLTNCAYSFQPESASVEAFQCEQIKPGDEYQVRVACRFIGQVRDVSGRLRRFNHNCIQLDRTTPPDKSPASWRWNVDYFCR